MKCRTRISGSEKSKGQGSGRKYCGEETRFRPPNGPGRKTPVVPRRRGCQVHVIQRLRDRGTILLRFCSLRPRPFDWLISSRCKQQASKPLPTALRPHARENLSLCNGGRRTGQAADRRARGSTAPYIHRAASFLLHVSAVDLLLVYSMHP